MTPFARGILLVCAIYSTMSIMIIAKYFVKVVKCYIEQVSNG